MSDPSSGAPPLPVYADEQLSGLSTPELWQLLLRNEDRVPRNVIDECARRGDEFLDLAADALESERYWTADDPSPGEAWLPVHAAMILGLMQEERAGVLLAGYMRRVADDEDLQDWLGGYWPAFFHNKPDEHLELVKTLAEDASLEWFMRSEAFDTAISMAQARGEAVLDSTLDWAARFAFDEKEDEMLRDLLSSALLDFARPRHRAGLEAIADADFVAAFQRDEIERIYAAGGEPPRWTDRPDPWSFYSPQEIEARQSRWADEEETEGAEAGDYEDEAEDILAEDDALEGQDSGAEDDSLGVEGPEAEDDQDVVWQPVETYVRPAPKIGRNDPCPCGSGKKYKKCCLGGG